MAIKQDLKNKTKDGRSWYFYFNYYDSNGKLKRYKSKKYKGKLEAKEQEKIYLMNISKKIEINDITFKELYLDYIQYQKDKVKITTLNNYSKIIKKLEYFHNIKLSDLNIKHYNFWKIQINKTNYSTKYKNILYKFFISLISYAEKYHNFDFKDLKLKMSNFNNPNEIKKEMDFYTYEEFIKYIEHEEDLKYKTFFEILYFCGLRKGEANALKWKNVDLINNTISIKLNLSQKIKGSKYVLIPPKTQSSIRTLPIPETLQSHLKLLLTQYQHYSNYSNEWFVFGGLFPLSDTSIEDHNKLNQKKANLKHIRIHDFRHSCASLLISCGANISLVSKYLGHNNITTTLNTYTHLYKSEMTDIIKIIDNRIKNN